MLDEIILTHWWVGIACFAALYCSDYALTIVSSQIYHSGVNQHIGFETFELTPYYQPDIAALRWVSRRFIAMLLITCVALVLIWVIATADPPLRWWLPNFYRAVLGGLILVELAIHERHFANLATYASMRRSQGIHGYIRYEQWLVYRMSAVQLAGFAVIYLVSFLLTSSWYFFGGALKCLLEAGKHWRLARKHASLQAAKVAVVEPLPADPVGPSAG